MLRTALAIAAAAALGACGRNVRLGPVPTTIPEAADSTSVALARALAPVLHVQRDEPFPLLRVVAVVHPTRPIVAYHLLWSHDVNGQWMPWTKPSDEEEVWVGYDSTSLQPTDVWTYWHGTVLHANWTGKGQPAVDVQWGKHGSMPYGIVESDLPAPKKLNDFYFVEYLLLPDMLLGKLSHGGPLGFFHSYSRYRDFSRIVSLGDRLDAVARATDARDALRAVFGRVYSNKRWWPGDSPDRAVGP